jgi:hypothetical protein
MLRLINIREEAANVTAAMWPQCPPASPTTTASSPPSPAPNSPKGNVNAPAGEEKKKPAEVTHPRRTVRASSGALRPVEAAFFGRRRRGGESKPKAPAYRRLEPYHIPTPMEHPLGYSPTKSSSPGSSISTPVRKGVHRESDEFSVSQEEADLSSITVDLCF